MKVVATGIVAGREDMMKASMRIEGRTTYRSAVRHLVENMLDGVEGRGLKPEDVRIEIIVDETGIGYNK